MDFLESELRFKFQKKFGGTFYHMIPDNILVYDNNKEVFLIDENKVFETCKESMNIGKNLFLLYDTLNFENKIF